MEGAAMNWSESAYEIVLIEPVMSGRQAVAGVSVVDHAPEPATTRIGHNSSFERFLMLGAIVALVFMHATAKRHGAFARRRK